MNIIITRSSVQYRQFLKLESLKEATRSIGTIDYLVYNESIDPEEEKPTYIDSLRSRVKKFVYIRDSRKGDDSVKVLMPALKGVIFDDEYFLEDEDELLNMLESLDEVTEITTMGGVTVVSDFFKKYLSGSGQSMQTSKSYLTVVKNAVKTMLEDYNKKNLELVQMSESASELFNNTAKALVGSKEQTEILKSQIRDFESKLREQSRSQNTIVSVGPSLNYFPQVQYLKDKKIIRFKELGSVPFLTSFIFGFRLHLEKIRNVRPKVIVVMQKGTFLERAYKDYPWVTQSTIKDKKNYFGNDIVFTNHPTSEVMNNLLKDEEYDTFIVLDRSFYDEKHILNSKGSLYYAIGSPRYIKQFRLPVKDCITSVISKGSWMSYIEYDESYPEERINRERFYLQNYKEEYEMLV